MQKDSNYNLNDTWTMTQVRTGKTYQTSVPCSVLSVLQEAGVIEDPYYRDNEKRTLDVLQEEYEFSKIFSVNREHLMEERMDLVFYGIDTLADIYLNGQMLAHVSDMHRTYRFSVKPIIKPGANEIRIHFYSPLKYIAEYQSAPGKEISYTNHGSIFGNQWIRKSHSMFGWDWGPKLPDIGLFRKVELECYSKARIEEVIFHQEHLRNQVILTVDPILYLVDNIPLDIEVLVDGEKLASSVIRMASHGDVSTKPGENPLEIVLQQPSLWWPSGMGEQNLYEVSVRIRKSNNIYDEKIYRIGLRTITVSREEDEYGKEFAFVVNGVKMFARGANYIPEDAIYPRIREDRQKMLLQAAKKANFNCIRVWGGGYYPSDEFYNLCDEYGLLVWQDLMFACNVYELTEELEENIVAEISDNVRRIRHHASLGLWCGNNEIESAWCNWEDFQKEGKALQADYIKIFEYIVPKALKAADKETFYWPSSPSTGGNFDCPEKENDGDSHYWEVWHGQKPFEEYQKHYFRFLSEFGFQSFPSMKTVESFTLPEDRNIFSAVMESHQKNDSANGKIMSYLAQHFLFPKDLSNTVYLSQILQGLAMKAGVEHLRRNRGRCMGTLYWQMNDNWPVASWSSIDYYGRWKALHYMAKRFYQPVAGSVLLEKEKVKAFVVNDTMETRECKIRIALCTMEGEEVFQTKEQNWISSSKVFSTREYDLKKYVEKYGKENVYLEVEFLYNNQYLQRELLPFVPYKHLHLPKPEIQLDVQEKETCFEITLLADVFTPFVLLDLEGADAVFSDNAFSLPAKKPVTIILEKEEYRPLGEYHPMDDFLDLDEDMAEIPLNEEICNRLILHYLQDSFMSEV